MSEQPIIEDTRSDFKEPPALKEYNPIRVFKSKWEYRNTKRENKRKYHYRQNELELKHIQTIDSPEKLAAYKHKNNTKKIVLAIKIGGFIITALISPQLAWEFIKNLLA